MLSRLYRILLSRVPDEYRPEIRKTYRLARDGLTAVARRRRPVRAERVVWLRTEVADLESFRLFRPRPREVLVRNHVTLISPGTERAFLIGLPNTTKSFPSGAGYSAAGVVEAVGKDVDGWGRGDRFAGVAPHASHALVTPDRIVPVPKGVMIEAASFVQLGVIASQAIRRSAIAPGERVVVIGLGLVGQLVIQFARWVGGAPLIGMARTRTHEGRARESGCDEIVDLTSEPDAPDRLMADVVIEATGSPDAILTALRSARPGGRVVLAGSPRGVTPGVDFGRMIAKRGLTVVGAHVSGVAARESSLGRWTTRDESKLFLDLVSSGSIWVTHLIERVVAPADANRVYDELVTEQSPLMGILFDWRKP